MQDFVATIELINETQAYMTCLRLAKHSRAIKHAQLFASFPM